MGTITNSIHRAGKFSKFTDNGFILEKNFLDIKILNNLKKEMQAIFWLQIEKANLHHNNNITIGMESLFHSNYKVFTNCGKHIQHLISAWELCISEQIISYLVDVLNLQFPNICTRPVLMFNNPHTASNDVYHTVPFHQDAKSMDGSSNSIVVWIPLQNTPKKLGAIRIIPRSHKLGIIAKEIDDFGFGYVDSTDYLENDITDIETELGDILFFDSKLIHASGENKSHSTRWSCQFRYNDLLDDEFITKGYPHPYLYKPLKEGEY